MDFITAALNAISNVFGWITNRSALNNSADMVKAKTNQNEQASVDKTNAAIANKDTKEIENEIS